MNLYLDTSAAVKQYLAEPGSAEVSREVAAATLVATSGITLVEVIATLSRAARGGRISPEEATLARSAFFTDWPSLLEIQATEVLLWEAGHAAWDHALRGYDALHLASALLCRNVLEEEVVLATFDRELWNACAPAGLTSWPADLAAFIGP